MEKAANPTRICSLCGGPIACGYFCGRLRRHDIGLPLAFVPLICFLAIYPFMFNLVGLAIFALYSVQALIACVIGFRYRPLSTKDRFGKREC